MAGRGVLLAGAEGEKAVAVVLKKKKDRPSEGNGGLKPLAISAGRGGKGWPRVGIHERQSDEKRGRGGGQPKPLD